MATETQRANGSTVEENVGGARVGGSGSRPAVHRRVRGTEEGLLRTIVYQFALTAAQGTADWAVSTAQIYVLTVQRLDVQDQSIGKLVSPEDFLPVSSSLCVHLNPNLL